MLGASFSHIFARDQRRPDLTDRFASVPATAPNAKLCKTARCVVTPALLYEEHRNSRHEQAHDDTSTVAIAYKGPGGPLPMRIRRERRGISTRGDPGMFVGPSRRPSRSIVS